MNEVRTLREARESIFDAPEFKRLLQDKSLERKTLISKFTILENNLSGVAG
jgi:hypothetical protein